jgi:AcrR family transcriptional regulator
MSNAPGAKVPTRRESRKQDRRQAILEAARASFMEKGYEGTSMSGLLETLGGSKATLWSYFRSKEELFAAMLDDAVVEHRAALLDCLEPTGDLFESLTVFCSRFLEKLSSHDSLALWRLVAAESARNPEIGRIFYERAPQRIEQGLTAFIGRHMGTGELRPDDPLRAARVLISLCTGRQHRIIWGVASTDAAAIAADAALAVEVFVRAYAAEDVRPERPHARRNIDPIA